MSDVLEKEEQQAAVPAVEEPQRCLPSRRPAP